MAVMARNPVTMPNNKIHSTKLASFQNVALQSGSQPAVKGELLGEFAHTPAHICQACCIRAVLEGFRDPAGYGLHLGFLHAARG